MPKDYFRGFHDVNSAMNKFLEQISILGGLLITVLGLIIMLIHNDTGHIPHDLSVFTLALVFVVGVILIYFMVRNRGIGP